MRKPAEHSYGKANQVTFSLRSVGVDEEASHRGVEPSRDTSFSLRSVGVDEEAEARAAFDEELCAFQSPLCRSG